MGKFFINLFKTICCFSLGIIIIMFLYYTLNGIPAIPAMSVLTYIMLLAKWEMYNPIMFNIFGELLTFFGLLWYGIAIFGTIAAYPTYGNWLTILVYCITFLAFLSFISFVPKASRELK